MTNDKKNVLNYTLIIRGVFGRNRSSKFQQIKLKSAQHIDPATPKTVDELMPEIRKELANIKFKSGTIYVRCAGEFLMTSGKPCIIQVDLLTWRK